MVAVTGGARRRAQVAADDHGLMMDAGVVLRKLVHGNRIPFHISGVRVAVRARLRNIQRVDLRAGVAGGP